MIASAYASLFAIIEENSHSESMAGRIAFIVGKLV
jgi:hypothetical protein